MLPLTESPKSTSYCYKGGFKMFFCVVAAGRTFQTRFKVLSDCELIGEIKLNPRLRPGGTLFPRTTGA